MGAIKNRKLLHALLCIIMIFVIDFCPLQPIFAQGSITLHRINGEMTLDGLSDENFWDEVDPLPLTMYLPTFQGEHTERTEIRVAYDDNFLYASGRFYDSEPSSIHTHSLYRDKSNNDDTFCIVLDTFNDKENALCFWTNPAGIRGDKAISNDGHQMNIDWNTFWDVRSVITDEGWFSEMRIPFSSLGFNKKSDIVTLGLIAFRYIDRKNEVLIYPEISPDYVNQTPSQAKEAILENIQSQNPVYITPYVLGGASRNLALNNTETGYSADNINEKDIGLDVKYNITNNLTIDATINTDFAQIEADDEQINLSRFSLFFPEKRRFFQERSGIFYFKTSGMYTRDRLFHSRRIGLHDGQAVRILGGLRLVGRTGPWDIGAFSMQTEKNGGLPSENFSVFRLRRQIINDNSYAGGILTSRIGDDGSYNYAYGLDGIFRLVNNEYLTLRWAQTADRDLIDDHSLNFVDASSFMALWERRTRMGLNYNLSFARAGKDFVPEMGYTTRKDYTDYAWQVQYDPYASDESSLRKYSPIQILGSVSTRNSDGSIESGWGEWGTDIHWKNGAYIFADAEVWYEDLREPLNFPDDTIIPVGSHTYYRFEGGFRTPPGKLMNTRLVLMLGQFFDGTMHSVWIEPVWSISKYLNLYSSYSLQIGRFHDRNQEFNAHLLQMRVEGAVNRQLSLNGFIQYNSVSDQLTPNIRFRYNHNEGNDLWLVYNESFNTDRERLYPVLPRSGNRALMVKYTYTFKR
ncbi:MAG: carbohydrate binding family 9 domain-containing protein [bacterium]|nr:carbohydrate binding family 9 domain-containing protein [bacterium]